MAADAFAIEIAPVPFIVFFGEARVEDRRPIGEGRGGDRRFTAALGEEAERRVLQALDADRSPISRVDGCRLAAGNNAVTLLYENAAFAVLAARKAVDGCAVFYFGLTSAKDRRAEKKSALSQRAIPIVGGLMPSAFL